MFAVYETTLRLNCRFRKLDSCVSMVQPAKDRMCNNISEAFDRARVGSILRERDVSPHVIIIGGIFCKNSSKVLCVEHDQMSKYPPAKPGALGLGPLKAAVGVPSVPPSPSASTLRITSPGRRCDIAKASSSLGEVHHLVFAFPPCVAYASIRPS